jgi:peptidylprolyl isomerase
MSKVESGQTVSVHYVGTLDDGTEFDSSRNRGEALTFQVGSGQLIAGFDAALPGMVVGEVKKVALASSDAYGDVNPEAFQRTSRSAFPGEYVFNVGEGVQGTNQEGQPVSARIHALSEDEVTLDFNHPLAGKNLNFEIELVDIQ